MTKKKHLHHNRKFALKKLLKKENPTFALNNGALVATWDYTVDQMSAPVRELEKYKEDKAYPLWDWFRMTNAKQNKLYYITFSFPHVYIPNTDIIAFHFAIDKYPIGSTRFVPFGKKCYTWEEVNIENEKRRDEYKDNIIKNYDFSKTLSEFQKSVDKKKNLDKLLVSTSTCVDTGLFDGFNIIPPISMIDMSIIDIFKEAEKIIFGGKLVSEKTTQFYMQEDEPIFFEEFLK